MQACNKFRFSSMYEMLKSNSVVLKIMSSHSNSRTNDSTSDTQPNEEQTQRVIREQHRISGEGRDKTIYDFPYAAAVAQVLKDLDFPTNKQNIIQHIEQKRSVMPESNEVLSVLQQIEEKDYNNVAEVTKAAGLVDG
jgi:signal transduction histidine kinase